MQLVQESSSSPAPAATLAELAHLGDDGQLAVVIQRLSLARSLAEIQEIVRTAARRLTGADGATFVLRDEECCYYLDEDAISPLWKGQRFPLRMCISGWTMLNRSSALIEDIYADPRIPHEAYRPTFVKSLAMVPIRQLDPVGAIGNYWAERHRPTPREVALLQALADSTAVAMESVRMQRELESAHLEILQRVTLAAEDERRRWARELHDETLQTLGGLRVLLARACREADLDGLRSAGAEAVGQIEREIASLRAIIADLRPPALDQLGLAAALASLAEQHEAHSGLHVECALTGATAALPADVETTIYRLVQEALTNVVKHSRARTAVVRVACSPETIEVEISDDGVGFDPDTPASGFGLVGIRERVGLLGGALAIESGPGATSVRATVPAPAAPQAA